MLSKVTHHHMAPSSERCYNKHTQLDKLHVNVHSHIRIK